MQASVRRLLSALALLTAGCVGRVDGNETYLGKGTKDAGSDIDLDAGRRPDARGEAGAVISTCGEDNPPLAIGLRVREVALYQSVKITLFNDTGWVLPEAREAPIVQGRQALVRVHVEKLPGFKPHDVRAVLRIIDDEGRERPIAVEKLVEEDSIEEDLATSFNFELANDQLREYAKLHVALEEVDCNSETGLADDAVVPAEGPGDLDVRAIQRLKIVVVPVKVGERTPLTDAKEREKIRQTVRAFYPVPDVDVSVREPLEWTSPVSATDTKSWYDLLNQLVRERQRDHVARDVYYLGVVQPAANHRTYCQNSCIMGLSPQTSRRMDSLQVAVSAYFAGEPPTYDAIVHELGHAHGRGHTNCSDSGEITGIDEQYPYEHGATGSWGWDFREKAKLIEPVDHKDMMGYCSPTWISNYTYNAIAERAQEVNGQPLVRGNQVVVGWESLLLYGDGTARWGGTSEATMPVGNAEPAEILDASGQVIDRLQIVRVPTSHTKDSFVYIPRPGPNWAAVKLADVTIDLSKVESAR